mmetsp:Transcript_86485/g.242091  ORF Transcript_86485/g.242091 Transcript_86485/m.242091 type:complete len:263 (-) Transcript_86485:50-838(-)
MVLFAVGARDFCAAFLPGGLPSFLPLVVAAAAALALPFAALAARTLPETIGSGACATGETLDETAARVSVATLVAWFVPKTPPSKPATARAPADTSNKLRGLRPFASVAGEAPPRRGGVVVTLITGACNPAGFAIDPIIIPGIGNVPRARIASKRPPRGALPTMPPNRAPSVTKSETAPLVAGDGRCEGDCERVGETPSAFCRFCAEPLPLFGVAARLPPADHGDPVGSGAFVREAGGGENIPCATGVRHPRNVGGASAQRC